MASPHHTGVSRDALRFYERCGLIASQRRKNGYRDYFGGTVQLVAMIKLARSFGCTLAEIRPEMSAIAALKKRRAEMADLLKYACPITAKT